MAIKIRAGANKLGRAFARAARNEPLARELWVSTHQDGVHLWLLIDRAGDDEERRIYGLIDTLDATFPDADFHLHVLNPASYTVDLHEALPSGAEEIALSAA